MPTVSPLTYPQFLAQASASTRRWLFDAALPLWWSHGADHAGGGFHEKLGMNGEPAGHPVRVRVQARQLFVYARAGALGWTGPWREAMRHALDFMLARHQRPDGFFRSTLDTADQRIDLYDQAFVLFALAHAWQAEGRPPTLLEIARRLMAQVDAHFSLEGGGYRAAYDAARPGAQESVERKSNPLMHLLEALLAWVSIGAGSGADAAFRSHASALCRLATNRLIDPETGTLAEDYAPGWVPLGHGTTRVNEPGHQFEWAWLLLQAQELLGHDMPSAGRHAQRLESAGRLHGIDAARGVAIFSVDGAGHPLDRRARLWAQTERLRTSMLFAQRRTGSAADIAAAESAAVQAFGTLQKFLATPRPGLWHEWMDEHGQFETAPAPASTLYHLVTGFESLLALAQPGQAMNENG